MPEAGRNTLAACVFCDFTGPKLRDYGTSFVVVPLNPVTAGHVLVIPPVHVVDACEELAITGDVFHDAARYIREEGIEAANIITSVGAEATQSVFHLHVHVVPRRENDGLALPWTETR